MLKMNKAFGRSGRGAMIALALAGLTACSSDGDEPEAEAPPEVPKVLAQSVRAIDFGRSYDGVVISVEGYAPGLGYQQPELRNHSHGARSQDGFAQFELVVAPMDEEVVETLPAPGSENALKIRAERDLPINVLRGLRGVRVYSVDGVATRLFQPEPKVDP